MPGISFLFKKKFHPQTMENQKKLFIAEEKFKERQQRERDAAKEVAKEAEIASLEQLGELGQRDPRLSSLKFMYSMPKKKGSGEETSGFGVPETVMSGSTEDDDMVKNFKQRLLAYHLGVPTTSVDSNSVSNDNGAAASNNDSLHNDEPERKRRHNTADGSKLERDVGRPTKNNSLATQEELAHRHPALKNAPVEGSYARDIPLTHKPFSQV
jgi:hypothetical protein